MGSRVPPIAAAIGGRGRDCGFRNSMIGLMRLRRPLGLSISTLGKIKARGNFHRWALIIISDKYRYFAVFGYCRVF